MRRGFVVVSLAAAGLVILAACSIILGNIRPVASFTADPTSGTSPLDVAFDASATHDPDGAIAIYFWSFGDGQTASATIAPHHQYTVQTDSETFNVVLTVIDNLGGADSAVRTIRVDP